MDKKDKEGLMLQVYKDTLQPAGKVVGRTVQAALAPLRGLLYSIEKVEEIIYEGVERRLADRKIAEEKIKTPAPEIAVPIMQALIYCGENEALREMYLNLLTSTMDSDKEKTAHRAYVQIVNQLSPLEAKIIAEFRPKTPHYMWMGISKSYTKNENGDWIDEKGIVIPSDEKGNPICESSNSPMPENLKPQYYTFPSTPKALVSYWLANELDSYGNMISGVLAQENVVMTDESSDVSLISAGITNLARLGLVEVDYSKTISKDSVYKGFYEHSFYLNWRTFIENESGMHESGGVTLFTGLRGSNMVMPGQYKDVLLKKGVRT